MTRVEQEAYDERVAIALESGIDVTRARAIAGCEVLLARAARMGIAMRCECGAGHRQPRQP